jgi:hypothetical protein
MRFVIDRTTHRLAPLGTKAALSRVPTRHRALHDYNIADRKDHHATDHSTPDAPTATTSCRHGTHAARLVIAVASVVGCGALAKRRRSVAMDRPRSPCAGRELKALRRAHHGPAFPPDRQVRRCRDGRGCCCRSICKHTKTGRRQISHATTRAAVGTLAGATLLFLQARLTSKNENKNKPANVIEGFGPKVDVQGGRARRR